MRKNSSALQSAKRRNPLFGILRVQVGAAIVLLYQSIQPGSAEPKKIETYVMVLWRNAWGQPGK
jgi:hypothetical protein